MHWLEKYAMDSRPKFYVLIHLFILRALASDLSSIDYVGVTC